MGYSPGEVADLQATIDATPCDVVLTGTPTDLRRILSVRHSLVRVAYEVEEVVPGAFEEFLARF